MGVTIQALSAADIHRHQRIDPTFRPNGLSVGRMLSTSLRSNYRALRDRRIPRHVARNALWDLMFWSSLHSAQFTWREGSAGQMILFDGQPWREASGIGTTSEGVIA